MNSIRFLQPAWLALLAVALTACGGDGDSSNPSAPTISGTPSQTARVGEEWSFQPTLSDPNGDALTVSVENRPDWLTLNPGSGLLRGTPGDEDVGSWRNIRMRVTDGQSTGSLPAFSINVIAQGAATGTATLSWSPPTQRADGSPIGQLAGYRVLWGQVSRNYHHAVQLTNPGITSYMIEDLGPGTWYFAVTAITTDGLESAPSQEASKTI